MIAIHDPLDRIICLRAVQQFIDCGFFRVFFEQLMEVALGVINVTLGHVLVRAVIRLLSLPDLKDSFHTELLYENAKRCF